MPAKLEKIKADKVRESRVEDVVITPAPEEAASINESSEAKTPRSQGGGVSRITLTVLMGLVAVDLYYHYSTTQDIQALKAAHESAPKETYEAELKALEAKFQSHLGDMLSKIATLGEKVGTMSVTAAPPTTLTDEQLKHVMAYLEAQKKDNPSSTFTTSEDMKTLSGLILMQVLQSLIHQGQPYVSVLTDLHKLFEERQWLTPELTVAFDILNISAKEGLAPAFVLTDLPHGEQTIAWPSYLSWLAPFVHMEAAGNEDLSRAQKQTLMSLIDRGHFEEASALIKRHLDQHPNLPAAQRDAWQGWIKRADQHSKVRHSMMQLQHALIEKGVSHVTKS